jgi:c(7)-type cytochrome triheme protein
MKKFAVGAFVFGMVASMTIMNAFVGQAEEKVKAGESVHVYSDASYAEKQGVVTFSHLDHKAAFGQEKLDCKPCHMTKPPLFSMKKKEPGETRPVMKMSEMAEGKFCGGCHNGKTEINGKTAISVTAEENCGSCHKKAS